MMCSAASCLYGVGVGAGVLVLILMQSAMMNGSDDCNIRVPAMFIFGDSTVDNGNNNKLYTLARANYPPYGRDFDTRHATGRFSNGRLATDFVAEFLGLPLVAPYLSPEASMNIYQGANFASAGAGILNRTGDVLGAKIAHWQQIELFLERRHLLLEVLGEQKARQYVKHSIFYLAIGGNDFIHNYITNDTDDALLTPDEFTQLLLSTLKLQLQALFDAGSRKIVILGVGPIGCLPHFLFRSNTTTGECVLGLNQFIHAYNARLAKMAYDFNTENHGSHVIYRDIFDIVLQMTNSPEEYGFTVGNTACCGAGMYGGGDRCLTPAMACENPDDFVWWDEFHPSHKASVIIASQVWNGSDPPFDMEDGPSVAYSMSFMTLQKLAQLDLDQGF